MKKFFCLLISIIVGINCMMAQSLDELLQRGANAFVNGNYIEAKVYLEKAADMGSYTACGMLALGYMSGGFPEGQDLSMALRYATKGSYMKDPTSLGALGMLGFHLAESKKDVVENIEFLDMAYEKGFSSPSVGNLICASYIVKGDKKTAEEWANKIISKEREDSSDFLMAKALLSKIQMDNKDFAAAMITAKNSANDGNPIAMYVLGRCLIKLGIQPENGRKLVKKAAMYDYVLFEDIKAFDEEIQKYYSSIISKKF